MDGGARRAPSSRVGVIVVRRRVHFNAQNCTHRFGQDAGVTDGTPRRVPMLAGDRGGAIDPDPILDPSMPVDSIMVASPARLAEGEGREERDLLLSQRVQVHIGVRASVRMVQALSPVSVAGTHRGLRIPAGLVTDLGEGLWMTRREPIGVWRLVIDSLETAVTTLCAPNTVDASRMAFMPTLNICMEAGIEGGPIAVLVPGALMLTAFGLRAVRGHRLLLGQAGWPVVATLTGAAFRVYLEHHRQQLAVANDRHMAAISSQAFRAGQLSEATRADSVVDEVQHALVLVEDAGGPRIRMALASWKASLVDAVRDEATYLYELLLRWEAHRNLGTDMSQAVRFNFSSDEVVLISGRQAAILWDCLDELSPSGPVTVTLDHLGSHLPGQALELKVGGAEVTLSADPRVGYQIGLTPIAAALAAVLVGQQASAELGSVPMPIASAGAAGFVALGVWSHRHLVQTGDRGRRIVAGSSLAIAAAYTAMASPRVRRNRNSSGVATIPAIGAIQAVTAFYGTILPGLTRRQRQLTIATMVAIGALGTLTLPERVRLREVLVETAWPMAVLVAMTNIATTIDDQTDRMSSELDAQRAPVADAAFDRGRRWVRSFCGELVSAASERMEGRRDAPETPITREARRRIDGLRARLISDEVGG